MTTLVGATSAFGGAYSSLLSNQEQTEFVLLFTYCITAKTTETDLQK